MKPSVVVAGALAQRAGYGGHAWVLLQYLLGFRKLGWDVLFLDRLEPGMCTDGRGRPCLAEESVQLGYLRDLMDHFGLEDSWAVSCRRGGRYVGLPREVVARRVRDAHFLLNIMGFLDDEQILGEARRTAFLDLDPGFGQMWRDLGLADLLGGHDVHLTVGGNVGRPDCPIPACGIDWVPTPPPVVLHLWSPASVPTGEEAGAFTSVGSWRGPFGPVEWKGHRYGLRVHEFRRFVTLPLLAGGRFELALDIHPDDDSDRRLLGENGWILLDPAEVAADPRSYREFVHGSTAEFMVAKQMYVDTRSGWISDRSACYLASGRPVVAQDTGFGVHYPSTEGLLAFRTLDDAVGAVDEVRSDPRRHAAAALEIAREYFDSDRVLGRMIERVLRA